MMRMGVHEVISFPRLVCTRLYHRAAGMSECGLGVRCKETCRDQCMIELKHVHIHSEES